MRLKNRLPRVSAAEALKEILRPTARAVKRSIITKPLRFAITVAEKLLAMR